LFAENNEETVLREAAVVDNFVPSSIPSNARTTLVDTESFSPAQSASVSTSSASARPNRNYFHYNSASETFRPTSSTTQPSVRQRHWVLHVGKIFFANPNSFAITQLFLTFRDLVAGQVFFERLGAYKQTKNSLCAQDLIKPPWSEMIAKRELLLV